MSGTFERFERALTDYANRNSLVSIRGKVCEASPTQLQISGLSRHANIGDLVLIETIARRELAEIVRVEETLQLLSPSSVRVRSTSATLQH